MATREVDELAEKVSSGLRLDPGGQLLDMEEMVYTATPEQLETLRKQVLQKQSLSGFDDEGLIKRIVQATKPKTGENGAGDNNQSYFNCFQNQIMMPTVVDQKEQMPEDLVQEWLCTVCPEAERVLVIASHKSTRVYDMEGTWICEHDTHLPGGSPSDISKVEDEGQCTILDCLYNDENEIYYVVDMLSWQGHSFYKYETSERMSSLREKMKALSSIRNVSQSNPFRFLTLPFSENSDMEGMCRAIAEAKFMITGLLFYHKRALYLPGLTPLGIWVETSFVPSVLNIPAKTLAAQDRVQAKQNWRKTRYEMSEEELYAVRCSSSRPAKNKKKPPPVNQNTNSAAGGRRQHQYAQNYTQDAYQPFIGYGSYGYGGYGSGYNMNYMYDQTHGGYYSQSPHEQLFQALNQVQGYSQYLSSSFSQAHQHQKKNKQGGDRAAKKVCLPVPDERPNWDYYERHEVMMSVNMEYIPENFDKEYVAVICPVAKRRIVVSYLGWTCSYNKLMNMDRKFQSVLPGGNLHSVQVIKSNDMCILDCLHLKADRTFYILDLMHWKQLPYYQSEAEFRFHWINQVESERDMTTIHPENEYKFKSMPRIPYSQAALYEALDKTQFKVDGILFFHTKGTYVPGTSPNVLWLPPENIESVLGWKPPERIIPAKKKAAAGEAAAAAASEDPDS